MAFRFDCGSRRWVVRSTLHFEQAESPAANTEPHLRHVCTSSIAFIAHLQLGQASALTTRCAGISASVWHLVHLNFFMVWSLRSAACAELLLSWYPHLALDALRLTQLTQWGLTIGANETLCRVPEYLGSEAALFTHYSRHSGK